MTSQTLTVGPRQLEELRDLLPLAHVVGHHHQDRRPGRRAGCSAASGAANSRTASRVSGVDHPGHRRLGARPDVGGGAGDGPGGGQAAEERRRRCWRPPGPPAPRSGCACRRSSGRRPRPTSATRWPPAGRPSGPGRAAAGSCPGRNCGTVTAGRPLGMPPNRVPMVSTGRPKADHDHRAEQQGDDGAGNPLDEPHAQDDDGQRRRPPAASSASEMVWKWRHDGAHAGPRTRPARSRSAGRRSP